MGQHYEVRYIWQNSDRALPAPGFFARRSGRFGSVLLLFLHASYGALLGHLFVLPG
jgi:hypothetical protein